MPRKVVRLKSYASADAYINNSSVDPGKKPVRPHNKLVPFKRAEELYRPYFPPIFLTAREQTPIASISTTPLYDSSREPVVKFQDAADSSTAPNPDVQPTLTIDKKKCS